MASVKVISQNGEEKDFDLEKIQSGEIKIQTKLGEKIQFVDIKKEDMNIVKENSSLILNLSDGTVVQLEGIYYTVSPENINKNAQEIQAQVKEPIQMQADAGSIIEKLLQDNPPAAENKLSVELNFVSDEGFVDSVVIDSIEAANTFVNQVDTAHDADVESELQDNESDSNQPLDNYFREESEPTILSTQTEESETSLDNDGTLLAVSTVIETVTPTTTLRDDATEPITIVDTTPPTAVANAITQIAGSDFIVNASEKLAGFTVKGTFTGSLGSGDSVQVSLDGKTYTATISGQNWTANIPSADVASITNGNAVAYVIDAAGNSSAASTKAYAVAPTLAVTDTVINTVEAQGTNIITGTSTGLETGSTVTVTLNSKTYTTTTTADGSWSLSIPSADGSALNEGTTYAVTVNASNGSDNQASELSQNFTVDKTPPVSSLNVDDIITSLPILTGQTTANTSVEVKLDTNNDGAYDDATYTVTSNSKGNWSLNLANVNPTDSSSPISYTNINTQLGVQTKVSDTAGNIAINTDTAQLAKTSYSISDSQVIEGTSGTKTMIFVVTREGDLSKLGSVDYAVDTALGLAKKGSGVNNDYTGDESGTVNFAVGESLKEITLTVNGDYYKEVNQNVIMELSNAKGGDISKDIGIGEISEVDVSNLTVAFSLRDINSDLATYVVRVRRSSDDEEMDIGFDKYGNLDQEALLKFVNGNATGEAVTGAKGYVTIWYDQSGNGRDASQTSNGKQGVIVKDGSIVTTSNGEPTVSFNQGLNGTKDEYMSMAGSGEKATNVEVYSTYQYESSNFGMMFNLGTSEGRVSVHAPHRTTTFWDVGDINSDGRLSTARAQKSSQVQQLVFAANYNHSGVGTAAQNKVDAKQAFFVDGEVKGADGNLNGFNQSLGSTWYLMSGSSSEAYEAGKVSDFLVYTSTSSTTATAPTVLNGSDNNNVITYAGESTLSAIDGKEGYDVVKVSSATTAIGLDTTAVSLKSIELIDMQNGQKNELTLNDVQLASNGEILNVRMDTGDSIVYNTTTILNHNNTQEAVIFGTTGDDTITLSLFNETIYGRGGNDIFVYKSWSDARTDDVDSTDTIADFTLGSSSGDRLDLGDLLSYTNTQDLANYIQVTDSGNAGDVTLKIDKNGAVGGVNFVNADQTIILKGVGTGSIDLNTLDDYNIMAG